MGHALIRATLVTEIIRLIAAEYKISESDAMNMYYKSATAESLFDDETGLYGQSVIYVFSEFMEERRSLG